MKPFYLTLVLMMCCLTAGMAQVTHPIGCTAGIIPPVPTLSVSNTIEAVADYTLFCSGWELNSTHIPDITFYANAPVLDPGPWYLNEISDPLTHYFGTHPLPNKLLFTDVPWDTSHPTLTFELHGVNVNPSAYAVGFQYFEISIVTDGPISLDIPVANSQQLVAVNAGVPEPSTFGLAVLGLAAAGFCLRLRPRRRA